MVKTTNAKLLKGKRKKKTVKKKSYKRVVKKGIYGKTLGY